MSESNPRLEYLFHKYYTGTCTDEEKAELLRFISKSKHDDEVKSLMDQAWIKVASAYQLDKDRSEHILSEIFDSFPGQSRIRKPRFTITRWRMAAALSLILMIAGWLIWHGREASTEDIATMASLPKDSARISNKAMLILANGTAVALDSIQNGVVAHQGGMPVVKMNGGLSYNDPQRQDGAPEMVYNTIVTPRGKQYQVILHDGTKVWLNAASSLYFPNVFSGEERAVALTGEAYFEVAPNGRPFMVNTGDMQVRVLGTHFDIRAYSDEPVTTATLLEGAVKISGHGHDIVLKPGQEAILKHNSTSGFSVNKADGEAAVAWKNGLFLFHNTALRSVMQDLEKWYDVQTVYKGDAQAQLNGMISREADLSSVLHMLAVTTNIKFRMEGKKVIVSPKEK